MNLSKISLRINFKRRKREENSTISTIFQSNFQKFKTNEPYNLIFEIRYIKIGVRFAPLYLLVVAVDSLKTVCFQIQISYIQNSITDKFTKPETERKNEVN